MKLVTYKDSQFYIDGQPVPNDTGWKAAEKEFAKVHYQLEAKKVEIEALRNQVKSLEG